MATYDLPYSQEHDGAFREVRDVENVIIVRSDGRSCQLLPPADIKDEAPDAG
jgi:hypothetical protein